MDFAAAGLLDGLEGPERQARQELLERLAADGVGLDELRDAVAEDRLVLLPVERELGGTLSGEEVARRAGVDIDPLMQMRRALGFPAAKPDEPVWSEEDVTAAKSLKRFLDAGMPEEAVMEVTRVLGEGMSRLSTTITGAFADTYLEPGDNERDVALRYAAMAKQLLPSMAPVLNAALEAYVRESARRGIIGRGELERGHLANEEQVVVCFADLVGFTSLGGQLEVEELGSVARQLAELAGDVATPPVRLVKTIGDAAMFVSPEASALVAAALSLVEAVESADLPALRAGLASGPVINRAGDWYGNAVNLASRVTGVARPASVLGTEDVRDAALDGFAWSSAGRFRLKGVDERQPLYRARRLEEGPDQPSADRERRASKSRDRRSRRATKPTGGRPRR
ncbi:MAG: adenylate/guanylate cyclase domain-containing protein [Actinobacteria bacterium]|nr:MAG: adenylate/guanylate cyclase domain-containing protein [Actinomycetota bacterium]